MVQSGWDVGTIDFSGTIPLLGIQPNQGNARQYVYHILKITEDELRLCAPEPGVTSGGGTAWFWNFKRKKSILDVRAGIIRPYSSINNHIKIKR